MCERGEVLGGKSTCGGLNASERRGAIAGLANQFVASPPLSPFCWCRHLA